MIEQTFSWLINYRHHAKDYEVLPKNSEAIIQIAMLYILIRKIASILFCKHVLKMAVYIFNSKTYPWLKLMTE
ncbi:hypothetical protein [Spartinivicinus poritis]|uniref:hypothetical protein n=1 Tax=Spartinivicinus poritis TaxID=2994640 RepID=UPI003CC90D7E